LIFVIVKSCVFFEVRTELLNNKNDVRSQTERERDRKGSRRVEAKRNIMRGSGRHFIIVGERKSILVLEGSHVMLARPSDTIKRELRC
jgi:hypothetical protein